MRLKEEVAKAIKTDDKLQAKIAAHLKIRSQSVWHLAHNNTSPKLHELSVLAIISNHLGIGIKSVINEAYENAINA